MNPERPFSIEFSEHAQHFQTGTLSRKGWATDVSIAKHHESYQGTLHTNSPGIWPIFSSHRQKGEGNALAGKSARKSSKQPDLSTTGQLPRPLLTALKRTLCLLEASYILLELENPTSSWGPTLLWVLGIPTILPEPFRAVIWVKASYLP